MAKKRVTDIVEEIVTPYVNDNQIELVDVEFIKEGQNWFLRVYIDKEEGISLDDCQNVSEFLSEKLDELDPISQNYFLEVSSPGLDRPLKKERDFEKFKGRIIEVHLYQPYDGKKIIEGELVGLKDGCVVLKVDGEEIEISRKKISIVRLAVII
ncbi:ribosome maturation factor RimP [Crassaminicella thermophila]|uniref:Ribosome maturation factor RimP n=1 Tax=Crassaminicella thermophila TaxID=2599308 RepID=A0A5C0SCH9_CRATE|nr:ribosome maturation factor RimP [Crassaminicella thermophila]QEK12235.1 ribosome maturation factor RimP [Crassaminicella thermophila]